MSAFELILRFPRGTVLIGGHASVPDGVHAVHARLPDQRKSSTDATDHRPFLPASAIRGALRESLEALLRADGQPACAGGNGKQPRDTADSGAASGPCSLDEGRPCRACRLFGGGRSTLPEGERMFSGLVLGEALPIEDRRVEWQSRFGVAIDRRRRSAADKLLMRRRVPEPGLGFRATGRLTTSKDMQLRGDFEAAVRATTHIGSGRSAGLARVEMEIRWIDASSAATPLPPGDSIEIAVELTAPASLGVPIALGNFRDTRRCIPGSALRGAVGFALAEALDDPNDPDFQALVDPDTGAVFDFLYPIDDASASGLAGAWPLTAQQCKVHPEHGVVDTLLDRIAVRCIRSVAEVARLDGSHTCPTCRGPLGGAMGGRRTEKLPAVQIVTRVSMDRTRSSARNGALFSYAQMVRGARFVGRIHRIPERGRHHLARALAGPLSVGRARSLGWGALRVLHVTEQPAGESIEVRGRKFDAALGARLAGYGLRTDRVGRFIAITLLSPLVIDSEADDGRETLAAALGIPVDWAVVARRFDLERGWDQRQGPRDVVRVARAGSVFVAELPEGHRWDEVLAALSRLETEGAGRRTTLGFGRVICFDPLIYQGAKKP
ncbi:MAG: RAMP superfamily CRISPR-associated protein [Minicystis sp.]